MNAKRLLLALLLLMAPAGLALAQDPGREDVLDDDKLTVTPSPVVFACTPIGESDTVMVTVLNPMENKRAVVIKDFESHSPHFIAPTTQNVVLQPGQSRREMVIFAPQSLASPLPTLQGEIRINQGSGHSEFWVEGKPSLPAGLVGRYDTLVFESGGPQPDVCVRFKNPSCRPVVITNIQISPQFRLTSPRNLPDTVEGESSVEFCVDYVGGPGQAKGTLTINSAETTLVVPLRAGPRPPSNIRVQPQRLRFFDVPANSTSSPQQFDVSNIGGVPDQLQSWEFSMGDSTEFLITPPSLPFQLPPGDNGRATFTVRFAPRDTGIHVAELKLHFAGSPNAVRVVLDGHGIDSVLHLERRTIDMGVVIEGESVELDTLVIRNTGPQTTLSSIEIKGNDKAFFAIVEGTPISIPNSGERRLHVRFAPDAARSYDADAELRFDDGGTLYVKLRGRGGERPNVKHRVWVDSGAAVVNEVFPLTVHIDPPLTAADGISKFRLLLHVDHKALYPHRAIDPAGGELPITYRDDDSVVIERSTGGVITGGDLVTIRFEGLVTGQPFDTVRLVSADFPELTSSATTGNGVVRLDGCDIGTGLGYSRPIAANLVWPIPARENVTVSYTAASGTEPWVRIVDVMGRTVRESTLPEGSGTEQRTIVATDGLGAGTYFVELHAGSERSVVRVIVEGR